MTAPAAPAAAPQEIRPGRALLFILLASMSFASLAASVKAFDALVGPEVGLGPPIFARGAAGLLTCLVWSRLRGTSLRPKNRGALLARCVIGGAAMLCFYWAVAILDTELGTATMLLKTSPLWVAVLSRPLLGEPTGPRTWIGLVLGAAGLVAVQGLPQGERAGILLCLVGGVLSALAYLSLRGLAATDDACTVVFAFSCVLALGAAPFLSGLVAALDGTHPWPTTAWALFAAAGVLGTTGQLLLTGAYRHGTAAAVTLGGLSEVALAMLASLFVFGQRPTGLGLVGGLLALSAGIIASSGPRPKPGEATP